jgi:hypothetical protein
LRQVAGEDEHEEGGSQPAERHPIAGQQRQRSAERSSSVSSACAADAVPASTVWKGKATRRGAVRLPLASYLPSQMSSTMGWCSGGDKRVFRGQYRTALVVGRRK